MPPLLPPLGLLFDPDPEVEPGADEPAPLPLLSTPLDSEPDFESDDPTFDPGCETELEPEFEVLSPDKPCPMLEDPDSESEGEPEAGG